MIKSHHFSRASGIAYMMQNRRILSRVVPEFFEDAPVSSIAETPLEILEPHAIGHAGARGLDVERISHGVNYDPPFDSEAYVLSEPLSLAESYWLTLESDNRLAAGDNGEERVQ